MNTLPVSDITVVCDVNFVDGLELPSPWLFRKRGRRHCGALFFIAMDGRHAGSADDDIRIIGHAHLPI